MSASRNAARRMARRPAGSSSHDALPSLAPGRIESPSDQQSVAAYSDSPLDRLAARSASTGRCCEPRDVHLPWLGKGKCARGQLAAADNEDCSRGSEITRTTDRSSTLVAAARGASVELLGGPPEGELTASEGTPTMEARRAAATAALLSASDPSAPGWVKPTTHRHASAPMLASSPAEGSQPTSTASSGPPLSTQASVESSGGAGTSAGPKVRSVSS
mmetsp:Transcript_45192/g.114408  ORF Transcript_45192/g.114408 Transcript_45192/m.114408 type:complete len:218 (+) Transcript_45192:542-1195(+)